MNRDHNVILERSLRAAYGRALGVVAWMSGNLDEAEDALQHAVSRAVAAWKTEIPENPSAWLIRAARNHLIDQARRSQLRKRSLTKLRPMIEAVEQDPDHPGHEDGLLQLILVCCHPSLAIQTQLILILRIVLGFEITAASRALLMSEDAVKKRLVRAKAKIRDAGIPFEYPTAEDIDMRLSVVCDALYLMFNEGFSRPSAETSINLCAEALRLCRRIAALRRDNRDVRSLLALMLLAVSRLPGRYDDEGAFVSLDLQDRSLWDLGLIQEGLATLDNVFQRRLPPTALQLQAAISACHCRESNAENTDWAEISALYERLELLEPTAVIRVNRAVALARQGLVADAATILCDLEADAAMQAYQPYHSAHGFVLERLGRIADATAAYRKAAQLTDKGPERAFLEGIVERLALLENCPQKVSS